MRTSSDEARAALKRTFAGAGMGTLTGASAVVTGAGRGIGRAIALRLAAEGARVTLVARTRPQLEATAAQIRGAGGDAEVIAADVTSAPAAGAAVERATARFGPVSLLVNNAGIPGPYGPIGTIDPLEWWAAQAVNVLGPLLFMSAVVPQMRKRGAGRILNIVSSAGVEPVPHLSAYAVSKNTLVRLTETVDLELRPHGVRAFALHPGTITTEMARLTIGSPEAQRWVPEGVAMLRNRTPEDSAKDLARCCDVVAGLAAGRYDALGGRYLDLWSDLETLPHRP
ncbi:MAG TPA: SDR family oxidoreductase [Steroidobacteraceae bacterium]|nr:SDR family oxidoreductase [Steroidobacteraceae bacterium]